MKYEISVVVIGKNESDNLHLTINSLSLLKNIQDVDSEFIYVDSASTDNSVDIASKFFDKVFILESSPNLCAAAGRNIGTINASKKWVLYLDGDMELCKEFSENIHQMISSNQENIGYLGKYEHIYHDGKIRSNGYGSKNNYSYKNKLYVRHFGGAVLLPTNLVLKAGNYNPGVFSNEEIDLYTRIKGIGGAVRFIDIKMIKHNTFHFSKFATLFGFYWPTKFVGKKFFGFGQLLASRFKNKTILNLIRHFPYPFIHIATLVISIALFSFSFVLSSLAITTATILYISYTKGFKFIILYPGFIMQTIFGYRKYDSTYVPKVLKKNILQRNRKEF